MGSGEATIQQLVNERYVDAHEGAGNDYKMVTRSAQVDDSQKWIFTKIGEDTYTIQHKVNMRYVDAYESAGNDHQMVTRTAQNDTSQRWIIKKTPGADDD